ncbi:MAG: hypothetical protein M3N52_06015, partial [Actinomycetota bacterium]|nr:hypothetical protein [Actinomycetota bacterium]
MPELEAVLARVLGQSVSVEVLKDKPGRRRSVRACGPLVIAVAKAYASARAPVVAARVAALSCS